MPGMRLMRALNRAAAEDTGAIAVLMAIVLTAVLVPLAAYGVNTYVRDGLNGELQRAADAGALAGAARIPLGNPSALRPYLTALPANPTPSQLQPLVDKLLSGVCPGSNCPTDIAESVCEQVLAQSDSFGHGYATSGSASCTASASMQSGVIGDIEACVTHTSSNGVNVLGGLLNTVIVNGLGDLLPGLLRPTITVTASETTHDPVGFGSGNVTRSRSATARRTFKTIMQLPTLTDPTGTTPTFNPNGLVDQINSSALSPLLTSLSGVLGGLNSACGPIVSDLQADTNSVLAADDDDPPTAQEVATEAVQNATPVFVLSYPTVSLGVPFAEFLPMCITQNSAAGVKGTLLDPNNAVGLANCSLTAPGLFKARLVQS